MLSVKKARWVPTLQADTSNQFCSDWPGILATALGHKWPISRAPATVPAKRKKICTNTVRAHPFKQRSMCFWRTSRPSFDWTTLLDPPATGLGWVLPPGPARLTCPKKLMNAPKTLLGRSLDGCVQSSPFSGAQILTPPCCRYRTQ